MDILKNWINMNILKIERGASVGVMVSKLE